MVGTSRLMASSVHEPTLDAGRRIRHSLRALLTSWHVGPDTIDDTLLVVEEFVANVVDHARTPFRLTLTLRGQRLRVSIRDCCDRRPRPRARDPHATRGRGLSLVGAITTRWGYLIHTTGTTGDANRGKTVWAELAV